MTSQLLLLCAPAFAGKTSLSLALEARGWLRISTDDLLRARGLEPGQGLAPEVWNEASLAACAAIEAAAHGGRDVVLDDTLCFRFLRERCRQAGARAGMAIVLAVLKVSSDEIRARVQANRRQPLRQDIDDRLLETHLATFEWPSADEPHIELNAKLDIEASLSRIRTALPGAV